MKNFSGYLQTEKPEYYKNQARNSARRFLGGIWQIWPYDWQWWPRAESRVKPDIIEVLDDSSFVDQLYSLNRYYRAAYFTFALNFVLYTAFSFIKVWQ
jgi:hypothetical protein